MPGPNSAPNGDSRLIRGHFNEEFVEVEKYDHGLDEVVIVMVPLRTYLAERNRLRTGKTK